MDVVIVGDGVEASRVVVGHQLRAASHALIVDYRGVAPRIVTDDLAIALKQAGTEWVDLGELRRPAPLLRVPGGPDAPRAMLSFVERFAVAMRWRLLPYDTAALIHFMERVLPKGRPSCSLREVHGLLMHDETCRWAWPVPAAPASAEAGWTRVRRLLCGALGYPHVAAIALAEATTPVRQAPWRWLEVPRDHVEEEEARVLAAVLHAEAEREPKRSVVLLHPPGSDVAGPLPARPDGLVLAVSQPANGSPPALIADLLATGRRLRIELLPSVHRRDARAWQGAVGARDADGPTDFDGQGIAFEIERGSCRGVPARLAPVAAGTAGGLALLRSVSRARRSALSVSHLARAFDAGARDSRAGDPYERLCDPMTLWRGWSELALRRSGETAGVDGLSLRGFGGRLSDEVDTLARELHEERYQPLPPVWTTIPKADGSTRRIGKAAVRDRVVQRAFVALSEPLFEPHFSDRSFAFRPRRGAHHAILALLGALRRGYTWVAHADVESCFDSLPHRVILASYARRVPSHRMGALLGRWLRFGLGTEGVPEAFRTGVVQGWSLSPFLSNVVLDDLDRQLEARGVEFVRYADDLAVLGHSEREVRDHLGLLAELLLRRLELRLKAKKTRIAHVEEGLEHLGFQLGGPAVLAIGAASFTRIEQELRDRIRALGAVTAEGVVEHTAEGCAAHLRGVAAYFGALGLTREMARQLEVLSAAIADERARLTEAVRGHRAWEALPSAERLLRQCGRFEAPLPAAGATGGPDYPDEPSPAQCPSAPSPQESARDASPAPAADAAHEDGSAAVAELGARVLTVLRGPASLRCDGDELTLERRGRKAWKGAMADLDALLVQARGVTISSTTAMRLSAADVTVFFALPGEQEVSVLGPAAATQVATRRAQAVRTGSPAASEVRRAIVRAKLANQAAVLTYLARAATRRATAAGRGLVDAARVVREAESAVEALDPLDAAAEVGALLGHEGRGAAAYWSALGGIVPESLAFPGRRGRGARDVLNQALNYAYAFLYADVWRAVAAAGLDPGFAFLHVGPRLTGGLVFDLVEELRAPLVDRLVFALLGRGWRPAHRAGSDGGLSARDRHLLARAWRRSLARRLRAGRGTERAGTLARRQAGRLRAWVLDKAPSYQPWRFRP